MKNAEESPAPVRDPAQAAYVMNRRMPVTRYCAYSHWMPQLAALCQCWRCSDRRSARLERPAPRIRIELRATGWEEVRAAFERTARALEAVERQRAILERAADAREASNG